MSTDKQNILKQKILDAFAQGDIAALYMLEAETQELFDEATITGYYKNILDLTLKKLTDTLEAKTKLDMQNVQDFAAVRALYEYAMEHYHAGKTNDAAALFEILGGITNDENFSKAMQIHTQAALKGIDLDTFLQDYADLSLVEGSGNFYIGDFTQKAHDLLTSSKGKEK